MLALNKRAPEMNSELHQRLARISKADWADLYFDAMRQFLGESTTDEGIMKDAEERLAILKHYRSAKTLTDNHCNEDDGFKAVNKVFE